MEPTWVAAASPLAVALGYVLVRRARRSRAVTWALVCLSLVALSTRWLFDSRRRGRFESPPVDGSTTPSGKTAAADGGEEPPRTMAARLRRRIAAWFR